MNDLHLSLPSIRLTRSGLPIKLGGPPEISSITHPALELHEAHLQRRRLLHVLVVVVVVVVVVIVVVVVVVVVVVI